MDHRNPVRYLAMVLMTFGVTVAAAQLPSSPVDQEISKRYFEEAETLCRRDDGRLWGISLCGPMVFADRGSETVGVNRPRPDAPWPRALGFANTALRWGELRWSTYVWAMIPSDDPVARKRMLMHELFHRVQFQLKLMTGQGQNAHLDTLYGRYWIQLEWRALARALQTSGPERSAAIGDALAFREARHSRFPAAAEAERLDMVREGLAQYTGTVLSTASAADARMSAVEQLAADAERTTYVRTAAYSTGAAYGLLLDQESPGWTRRIDAEVDLALLLKRTGDFVPTPDAEASAARYGAADLMASERDRDVQRQAHLAVLRGRYVDGPRLVLPRANGAHFTTLGATPLPGQGTVLGQYSVEGPWGELKADWILVSSDGKTLVLPAPDSVEGRSLAGEGWTVEIAEGWRLRPDGREGDYRLVPDQDR